MNSSRRITSHDVASLAGVSQATVSRAFVPGGRISKKTKKIVIDAAEKLGYQPNIIARSLAKRESNLIGILMANWQNPRLNETLQGFSSLLKIHGYKVILQSVSHNDTVDESIRDFLQYQVDGIILISAIPSLATSAACLKKEVPIVIVNRFAQGFNACSVTLDGASAGQSIADDLLDREYKNFVLLRGNPDIGVITDLFKTFRARVAEKSVKSEVNEFTNVSGYSAGRKAIVNLWGDNQAPVAVVCSSDFTAFGVQAGARYDLKIQVPNDLGIVGIGDSPFSWWPEHDLTTLHFPVDDMVESATNALIARIKEPILEPESIHLEAPLVIRGTTNNNN